MFRWKKIRYLLFATAFGLAFVPFVKDVRDRWIVGSIDVPETESSGPIVAILDKPRAPRKTLDEMLAEGRDLSLYEFGGSTSCSCGFTVARRRQCEAESEHTKRRLYDAWNEHRRFFVVHSLCGGDAGYTAFVVVEPSDDRDGSWRVRWITSMGKDRAPIVSDARRIDIRTARPEEYWAKRGSTVYSFKDESGTEVESF